MSHTHTGIEPKLPKGFMPRTKSFTVRETNGRHTPLGTFLGFNLVDKFWPEDAARMAEDIDHRFQRAKIDMKHVRKLATLMDQDRFPMGFVAYVHCPWDPEWPWKIGDGAHTLNGVVESGVPIRCGIMLWRCDNRDQWPGLWAAWGLDTKQRSMIDEIRMKVNADDFDAVMGVPPSAVDKMRQGLITFYRQILNEDPPLLGLDQLDLIDEYPLAMRVWAKAFTDSADRRILKRPSTLAALVATCVATDCDEWPMKFWMEVASGMFEVHDKRYPPYVLHQFLRDANVLSSSPDLGYLKSRRVKGVTPRDMIAACINAWNSWLDRRHMRAIKTTVKGIIPEARSHGRTRNRDGAIYFGSPLGR